MLGKRPNQEKLDTMEYKKACVYCLEDPRCQFDVVPGTDYCEAHLPEPSGSSFAAEPYDSKDKERKVDKCDQAKHVHSVFLGNDSPESLESTLLNEYSQNSCYFADRWEFEHTRAHVLVHSTRGSKDVSASTLTFLENFKKETSTDEDPRVKEFEIRKDASSVKTTQYDLLGKFDMRLNLKSWTVERAKKTLESPYLDTTLRKKIEEALANHVPLKWNLEDLKYADFLWIREREEELRTLYATDRSNPRIQELEVFYPIWTAFDKTGCAWPPSAIDSMSKQGILAARIQEIISSPSSRGDEIRERLSDGENILFNEAIGVLWESSYEGLGKFIEDMPPELSRNAIVAGGSALNQVIGAQNSIRDIDIFLWGLVDEKAASLWLLQFSIFLYQIQDFYIVSVVATTYSTTFILCDHCRIYEIQVINRVYMSPVEVVTGFDLDSCCFWIQEGVVYTTPRGLHALVNRVNVFDEGRMSTTYAERLVKYVERGFRILVPGLRNRGQWSADVLYRGSSGIAKILKLNNKRLCRRKQKKAEPKPGKDTDYGFSMKMLINKLKDVKEAKWGKELVERIRIINGISITFAENLMYSRAFEHYQSSTIFYYHCCSTGFNPVDAVVSIISGNSLKDFKMPCQEDHFKCLYAADIFSSFTKTTKETEYVKLVKGLIDTYGAEIDEMLDIHHRYPSEITPFERLLQPEMKALVKEYRRVSGVRDELSTVKILCILWALSPKIIAPISWLMENPGTQNKIGSFQPIHIDPFEDLERFRFIHVDE